MFVVVGRSDLSARPGLAFDRVRIVKSDQALTVRPVQRQRIIEAVRLHLARRDPSYDEPDPMPGFRIDDQNLPVQIKQGVKRVVPLHLLIIITQ